MSPTVKSAAAEDAANRLLTFMHLCETEKHDLAVPLKNMDGAVAIEIADVRSTRASEIAIMPNDGPPALWPVDLKTVVASQPESGFPPGSMVFVRLCSITAKQARPYNPSRLSRLMLMEENCCAKPDGTCESSREPLSYFGGRWVRASPHHIVGGDVPEVIHERARLGLGVALTLRYEWSVWFGHNAGPRVRFLTDPRGAMEAFRLRDLPPGRERRVALRNWVEGHTRSKRSDEEAKIWVRKHLRGATDFSWNGLRCRIQPSDFDIEQNTV